MKRFRLDRRGWRTIDIGVNNGEIGRSVVRLVHDMRHHGRELIWSRRRMMYRRGGVIIWHVT